MSEHRSRDIAASFNIEMYWDDTSEFPEVYDLNQYEEPIHFRSGKKKLFFVFEFNFFNVLYTLLNLIH